MDLDAVMKKFDRESNTRVWEGVPKIIVTSVLALFSLFCIYVTLFANLMDEIGEEIPKCQAVESVDDALKAVEEIGGVLLITADHGNAEQMWDEKNNAPWTAHTTNPVNFVVVGGGINSVKNGGLADIAPTILKILGIKKPAEMTGNSLV